MQKTPDNRAWLLVLPVFLLVAFNAILPLMTVVNYSVQDVFDATHRAFVGADWFREMLHSPRLHHALWRQFVFSGLVLLIELPLGVAIALVMPKKGGWATSLTLAHCRAELRAAHDVAARQTAGRAGLRHRVAGLR